MAKQRLEWTCCLPECVIIACHGISIKSFVWIFFIFALISFVITYIHVMLVLEFNKSDGQLSAAEEALPFKPKHSHAACHDGFNYDYMDGPSVNIDQPRHGDWPNKNLRVKIEDEAREGNNMIATKIIDTSLTEMDGWWMPNARWRAEIDCKTGLSHICRKTLSVACDPSKIHSIYQFIPINPDVEVKMLQFSATSSSPGLRLDDNYDKDSTIHSAIAYLKYSDSTVDHIRLDFQPGSFIEEKLKEEKGVPFKKRLESVTVVLACRGFRGVARFHETYLMPTGPGITDGEAHVFSCKAGQRSASFNESKAVIEKLIQVKPSPKGSLFEPTVSLVTQVNMDHIGQLHSMLSYWKHPISAAVFVPGEASEDEGSKNNWKKSSVIFGHNVSMKSIVTYIQNKLSRMKFPEGSSVSAVYAQSFQDIYHQNFLRNLALSATSEDYVFLLDAGVLPSPGFVKQFQEMMHHLEDKGKDLSRIAFVVPVFQMVKELTLPNSKDELKKLVIGDDPGAVSFKRLTDPDAHRSTDYRAWFRAKEPYEVEVYHEKYEPYVILKKTKHTPKFDERFLEGPLDRISYTMELLAAGYDLIVLPNVWAMAEPSLSASGSEINDYGLFHQTELYIKRFEFIAELSKNYKIGPCQEDEDEENGEMERREDNG